MNRDRLNIAATEMLSARYYPVARLAHLERLASDGPVDFIYSEHRADWDEEFASSIPRVHRLNFLETLLRLWKTPYQLVEIPEPLAISLLPRLVVISLLIRSKAAFGRKPAKLVVYAIENFDQASKVSAVTGIPYRVVQRVVAIALRMVFVSIDRIAFGTEGARRNYENALGRSWPMILERTDSALFEALPSPILDVEIAKDKWRVCFVGAFDDRKGVRALMAAWPLVVIDTPEATLQILGHGPLATAVTAFASGRPEISLHVDPARDVIWAALSIGHCLVLPSRRTPKWREQVGLPILEALSMGCEIVTTAETGIASWLAENGHRVIDTSSSPGVLAGSICDALKSNRPASDVLNSLPRKDTRAQADAWLLAILDD